MTGRAPPVYAASKLSLGRPVILTGIRNRTNRAFVHCDGFCFGFTFPAGIEVVLARSRADPQLRKAILTIAPTLTVPLGTAHSRERVCCSSSVGQGIATRIVIWSSSRENLLTSVTPPVVSIIPIHCNRLVKHRLDSVAAGSRRS